MSYIDMPMPSAHTPPAAAPQALRGQLYLPAEGADLRGEAVDLHVVGQRLLAISAQGQWAFDLPAIHLREPFAHAPLVLELPHGGVIELAPGPAAQALIARLPVRRDPVERWARSPRALAVVAAGFAAFLALCYWVLLPAAAAQFAGWMPVHLTQKLDTQVMKQLDADMFKPSKLPEERQDAIEERFAALKLLPMLEQPRAKPRLLFRDAGKMVNAFALPGGTVVITDALVKQYSDDIILGILAHEIGHVAHQHGLKNLARSTAVGLFFSIYVGDFSTIAAGVGTFLEVQRYTRENEREADAYAVAVMRENGIDPAVMAEFFRRIQAKEGSSEPPAFLNSHPGHEDRVRFFEQQAQPAR
jgi:Zn-dependent protease with chaperone function